MKLDSVGGSHSKLLSRLQRPCLALSLSHSKLRPPLLCHGSEVQPPTLLLHCWGLQVYLICHPILLQVILHSLIPTVVGGILVPCANRLYGPVLTLWMYLTRYESGILQSGCFFDQISRSTPKPAVDIS